ncbi:unnamed protein product [Dovyalis caffra]|uniref:Uncharacterized protein n=1 Tax=Dovyalis caffra TaxID=77055 RepID=A0AAV1SRJ8_9ROSI|nr:unnamed protein product [Dovyalis caffra]
MLGWPTASRDRLANVPRVWVCYESLVGLLVSEKEKAGMGEKGEEKAAMEEIFERGSRRNNVDWVFLS